VSSASTSTFPLLLRSITSSDAAIAASPIKMLPERLPPHLQRPSHVIRAARRPELFPLAALIDWLFNPRAMVQ